MKNSQKVIATLVIVGTLGTATAFAATDKTSVNAGADFQPQMKRGGIHERMQKQAPSAEIIEAIESGNYDAWVVLHEGKEGPMIDMINADNFGKLQEMHEARQNQDFEAAKAIAEELGLPARNKNMKKEMKKMGPSSEMIEAIESGDYDTWVALHEGKEGPMIDMINADNFGKFQELHEAKQNGDFDAAKEIAEELELPAKKGMGRKNGNGMRGQGQRQNQQ